MWILKVLAFLLLWQPHHLKYHGSRFLVIASSFGCALWVVHHILSLWKQVCRSLWTPFIETSFVVPSLTHYMLSLRIPLPRSVAYNGFIASWTYLGSSQSLRMVSMKVRIILTAWPYVLPCRIRSGTFSPIWPVKEWFVSQSTVLGTRYFYKWV